MKRSKKTKLSKQQPSILKFTNQEFSSQPFNNLDANTKQAQKKKLIDKITKIRQQQNKKKAEEVCLMNKLQRMLKLDEIANKVSDHELEVEAIDRDNRYVIKRQWMCDWQLSAQKIYWRCGNEESQKIDGSRDWFGSVLEYNEQAQKKEQNASAVIVNEQNQSGENKVDLEEETVFIWKQSYFEDYEPNFGSVLQKLSKQAFPHQS